MEKADASTLMLLVSYSDLEEQGLKWCARLDGNTTEKLVADTGLHTIPALDQATLNMIRLK